MHPHPVQCDDDRLSGAAGEVQSYHQPEISAMTTSANFHEIDREIGDRNTLESKRIKMLAGCYDDRLDYTAAAFAPDDVLAVGISARSAVSSQCHSSSTAVTSIPLSLPLPSFPTFSAATHPQLFSPSSVAYGSLAFSPAHAQPPNSLSGPPSTPHSDYNRPGVYYGGPPKGLFEPTPPAAGSSRSPPSKEPL
jgi:hypothetical protein